MINVEKETVTIAGELDQVLAELYLVIRHLYDGLSKTIGEDMTKKIIDFTIQNALEKEEGK